jgi:enoyl-CoA hydratase/carnithine racemase
MSMFDDFRNRYKYIWFDRSRDILQMTIHRDGAEAQWEVAIDGIHAELVEAFHQVGRDMENKVVIFTGADDALLRRLDTSTLGREPLNPQYWDRIYKEGKDLLQNLLEIEVPIIGAINGDARIHAELICLSDIVPAADGIGISNSAHSPGGTGPGDGVHVVWPMLLGPNRGRYFLMTGEQIAAQEAKRLGVVAEVLPKDRLLDRAWEIAQEMVKKTLLMLRYSRVAMTQDIKRRLPDDLATASRWRASRSSAWRRPDTMAAPGTASIRERIVEERDRRQRGQPTWLGHRHRRRAAAAGRRE